MSEEYAIEEYAIQVKPNNRGDWEILAARFCDLNEAKKAARIIQENFLDYKVVIIGRPLTVWQVVKEGGAE